MFTRLLVGLDGSPGADAALEAAIGLARRFKTTIVLAAITDIRLLEAPLFETTGPLWTEGLPAAPIAVELRQALDERAAVGIGASGRPGRRGADPARRPPAYLGLRLARREAPPGRDHPRHHSPLAR